MITAIRGGWYYRDRKINFLQELAWWVTDLTLRGKIIDLNHFKTGIIDDAIQDSRLDFEKTRDGKGGMGKLKEFSHEN